MMDNELNFSSNQNSKNPTPIQSKSGAVIFNFDPRAVVIFIIAKWSWILAVFSVCFVALWVIFGYKGKHGDQAWTASAKILHQARSDRLPSFYKPLDTPTVMQFISSRSVFNRVASKMRDSDFPPNPNIFKNVSIALVKGRKNMIGISVSEKSPEFAAAVANALAEEGIKEYVRTQSNSVKTMIDERTAQREKINKEISALEDEKKKFHSEKTGLSPTVELESKRGEISTLIAKQSDAAINLKSIETRIEITKKVLEKTPTSVEYETVVDNNSGFGLEGKKIELELMRKRYTEENPKIKVLTDEIQILENRKKSDNEPAARVTYRKNDIHTNLLLQLTTLELDLASARAAVTQYDAEIISKRKEIESLLERQRPYEVLAREQKMLEEKASKLNDKTNDLEILLSSATPDVYVFEAAKVPSNSNASKAFAKAFGLSLFLAGFFAFLLVAYRVAKMKIMSSKEFKIALGIDNLGEIPEDGIFPEEARRSAVQRVRRNMFECSNDSKIYSFIFLQPRARWDDYLDEMANMNAINGLKSFRLKCILESEAKDSKLKQASDSDKIATQLISIKKFADSGEFYYQSAYTLDLAERDLLEFDLDILSKEYDLISIEITKTEYNSQVCAQLAALSNYIAYFVPFDKINKLELSKNIEHIREVSKTKIGGILLEVPKFNFKH